MMSEDCAIADVQDRDIGCDEAILKVAEKATHQILSPEPMGKLLERSKSAFKEGYITVHGV